MGYICTYFRIKEARVILMKYIDIYSNMRPQDPEKHGIMCSYKFAPCSVCGHPTCYVEINYEGYFCSEECLEQFENELWGKK